MLCVVPFQYKIKEKSFFLVHLLDSFARRLLFYLSVPFSFENLNSVHQRCPALPLKGLKVKEFEKSETPKALCFLNYTLLKYRVYVMEYPM